MSIATDFAEIATIEEDIRKTVKQVADQEVLLISQIVNNIPMAGDRAVHLAGLRIRKELLPTWIEKQRDKIYILQNRIETQKTK